LVLQIAAELRAKLPALLDDHPLRHAWVYKCDNAASAQAIAPHADEAAVNINLWLVDGWQQQRQQRRRQQQQPRTDSTSATPPAAGTPGVAAPVSATQHRCGDGNRECTDDDDEEEDGSGGGLRVWLKEVPPEFDFQEFNREPSRLLAWLAAQQAEEEEEGDTDGVATGIEERVISHRVNRAVVFDSALVHQSDVSQGAIRPGCRYEDRRMNLTLLFGHRVQHAKQAEAR
jgi:hypothetical protein